MEGAADFFEACHSLDIAADGRACDTFCFAGLSALKGLETDGVVVRHDDDPTMGFNEGTAADESIGKYVSSIVQAVLTFTLGVSLANNDVVADSEVVGTG